MKKIILGLVLAICVFGAKSLTAQTDTTMGTKYYYYPSQNVYYNETSGDYWYWDTPTSRWTTVRTLPSTYTIDDNTNHVEVIYNGTDVWKENKKHIMKYKAKKNGKVKMKPKH